MNLAKVVIYGFFELRWKLAVTDFFLKVLPSLPTGFILIKFMFYMSGRAGSISSHYNGDEIEQRR